MKLKSSLPSLLDYIPRQFETGPSSSPINISVLGIIILIMLSVDATLPFCA
jgi:hypothetical protein